MVAGLPASRAGDVRTQSGVRHQARLPRQSAGELLEGSQSADERLPAGRGLIQGKAAALDANYGTGHIILLGFRPQWRGQSHGTYKFFFNALYYNPSMAPEAPAREGGRGGRGGGNPQQAAWRREAEAVKTRTDPAAGSESRLLHGARPAGRGGGQETRDRARRVPARPPPLLEDLRAQVEDAAVARSRSHLHRAAQASSRSTCAPRISAPPNWKTCWINTNWRWCHE